MVNHHIVNDEKWAYGNFAVVTYDLVRFRLPEGLLLAHSTVFSDAHAVSSGEKQIEFVDEHETSEVFAQVLSLITRGEVKLPKKLDNIRHLANFLRKWDFQVALQLLLCTIQGAVAVDQVSGIHAFALAAELGDEQTAKVAVRQTQWRWDAHDGGVTGRCTLDPHGWPDDVWHNIMSLGDPNYFYALSRAYKVAEQRSEIPKYFDYFLALAKYHK